MAFKRILIAVDTSEIALHAMRVGLELASELGAAVAVVHVIEPTAADASGLATQLIELNAANQGVVSEILSGLKGQAPIPEAMVKFEPMGAPVEAIVQVAREWTADLIVIGSHGREGVGRVLLGSVAEGVARRAHCPVLIARR
jgi:nucleotide-binding universal stress UspA family protein